jgi:hypothetical protein
MRFEAFIAGIQGEWKKLLIKVQLPVTSQYYLKSGRTKKIPKITMANLFLE